MDYTFPATSVFASRKVTKMLMAMLHDLQIEDLWNPFFCVSSNLSEARPVVHRQGLLWKAVRASIAIPGIFSPVCDEGSLLVDGGIINNVPIDIMRKLCEGGYVIAVNASPIKDKYADFDFGPSVSGWRALLNRVNPFVQQPDVPSFFDILMRSIEVNSTYQLKSIQDQADLLLQPSANPFGILEWEAFEEIIELGYESAKPQIEAWLRDTTRRHP